MGTSGKPKSEYTPFRCKQYDGGKPKIVTLPSSISPGAKRTAIAQGRRAEHTNPVPVDALRESVYIRSVPGRKIQVGQVWKQDGSGESYLITKVYSEALTTYAVLRKAGAETERPMRVKVSNSGPSQSLPGFTFTQESDEF